MLDACLSMGKMIMCNYSLGSQRRIKRYIIIIAQVGRIKLKTSTIILILTGVECLVGSLILLINVRIRISLTIVWRA